MVEAQFVLASVLRNYTFTLKPGYEFRKKVEFTVKPWQGMPVRLSLRQ